MNMASNKCCNDNDLSLTVESVASSCDVFDVCFCSIDGGTARKK